MGDERGGVYFALFDEGEDFGAVAAVHSACFEGQVFAVHVGQGEKLGGVIEGYDGDGGVGAGTVPCQVEGVFGSGYFEYDVGSAVVAVLEGEIFAVFRGCD